MTLARTLLAALAPASLIVLAQAPPPAPPAIQRLDIVALDSQGQPVLDLKPGELQVLDQNKPQRIVYFHAKGGPAATPAPGEFSNRAAALPHTTAILLDIMNQPKPEALDTWKKLRLSLEQLSSGESLYFYVLDVTGSLVPIHPIPPDPWVSAADDKTWPQQLDSQTDRVNKMIGRTIPAGMLQEDTVKKTYVALETLGRQLVSYSGERNILWVMRDVPSVSNPKTSCSGDWLDCALYTQHLCVTLEHADVPVYPVSYATISNPDTNRGMVDIAGLLGGRPFFGDDIREVIAGLAKASAGGYVLAYEQSPQNLDEKFHRVKVTCDRKDVKIAVRYRYYAHPETRTPPMRAQEALAAALRSPFDDPQIGLRATASPGAKGLAVQVQIDAADLWLREEGGVFTAQVAILMAGYSDKGAVGSPVPMDFTLRLTKEQYDGALKQGLPFGRELPTEGLKKIRFFIYDHSTGALGSLSVPVAAAKP